MHRPKIFLVDDSRGDGVLLDLAFVEAGRSVNIVQAYDGTQAFELLHLAVGQLPFPYRLIVLDLHLPKVDGLELLLGLKSWPELSRVPIVILTSSSNPMDRQRSLKHHPCAFLTKSEDYKGLAAVIGKLVPYLFMEGARAIPLEPLVLVVQVFGDGGSSG